MKNNIYFYLLFLIFICCADNNTINNNNPNIPNYSFSVDINLDLPLYRDLDFAGGGYLITQQGAGVRGVFVFNTGSGFAAYDAACPNQPLSNCSTMVLSGISANCPCDKVNYSLFTGLAAGQQYPLKVYRTEVINRNIRIFN